MNCGSRRGQIRLPCLGFLAAAAVFAQASATTNPGGPVFYVAPDGNDTWPGTLRQPFATVAHARDTLRRIKDRSAFTGPVTVYVRGGTYTLPDPLVFTPEDSGTRQSPTVYKAYADETPVLSGGRAIAGWRRIRGANEIPQAGAPPFQEDLWMAELSGTRAGRSLRELFVNGQRRQRARIPTRGFLQVEGQISRDNPAQFRFRAGDFDPAWLASGEAEVGALLKWGGFHLRLKAVDTHTRTLTLSARRQPWGDENNPRYWVENVPQALDAPGEWYLDRQRGVLYYHAMAGEDMARAAVVAPLLRQLIRFTGDPENRVHDISLEGLTLSYTDSSTRSSGWIQSYVEWSKPEDGHIDEQAVIDVPAAIEGAGADSIAISRCTLNRLGGYAVHFHGGAKENRVTRNSMADLGAGGVKIGDGKSPSFNEQSTTANIVSDNSIHDIGIVYPAAVGILIMESSANLISHNEIYNTYYSGISIGWTWGYGPTWARDNVIEFNHLYNIGRGRLSDLGCVYTVGVQPGTTLRNNLCHDVTRYENGYGGWGIYTDEGSGSILVENNVIYQTQDGGFHQHFGRDNMVRNNIFALGRTAQLQRSRAENHKSFTVERNIFYWKDAPLLVRSWKDGNYQFDRNLYFQAGGGPIDFAGRSFAEWQKSGQDRNSLVADPLFVNPAGGDFSLQQNSPASKIGFVPIDVTAVGPRRGLP